jgi:hypothetical protein
MVPGLMIPEKSASVAKKWILLKIMAARAAVIPDNIP